MTRVESAPRRLLAVLAHPDDESLGFGGTLAKYAAEGVEVFLLTATRGDSGRFRGHRPGTAEHPGQQALGEIREAELRAAAAVLGIGEVTVLGYPDSHLDQVNADEAISRIAAHVTRVRPDVVVTFGPDGVYGHPDHIAISQFTTAAVVTAAESGHAVTKLYYLALSPATLAAYQSGVNKLSSTVDGIERQAVSWPDWQITTVIDTRHVWPTVRKAVGCHESQILAYDRLPNLAPEHHEALWGVQSFYRVFSRVNGGRARETDLFEGITK